MSDSTENTAEAGENVEQTTEAGFNAPQTQEDLDRIVQKRIERERAKYADYDDLKRRAEKAEELESVTADLRKRVESFEARDARISLVSKVAKDNGVDADLLAEMRGESEDDLTAQAKRLVDRLKPVSPVIPGQAKSPENVPRDELREFTRQLFNKD